MPSERRTSQSGKTKYYLPTLTAKVVRAMVVAYYNAHEAMLGIHQITVRVQPRLDEWTLGKCDRTGQMGVVLDFRRTPKTKLKEWNRLIGKATVNLRWLYRAENNLGRARTANPIAESDTPRSQRKREKA